MLELYIVKNTDEALKLRSEFQRTPFGLYDILLSKINYDKTVCSLLRKIDNVEYAGGMCVNLPKLNHPFFIGQISDDCKTAIMVYNKYDRIPYIGNCGKTALKEIFTFLDSGRAYIDYPFELPDFDGEVLIHGFYNGVVKGSKELSELIKAYYGDDYITRQEYRGGDKTIKDRFEGRYYHYLREEMMFYDLKLKNRVTVIDYDNDLDKSRLFNMLWCLIMIRNIDSGARAIDTEHNFWFRDFLTYNVVSFKEKTGKIMFIDDGLNMLTTEARASILDDENNQYIIFTHNTAAFGSLPDECFAQLVIDGNKTLLKFR